MDLADLRVPVVSLPDQPFGASDRVVPSPAVRRDVATIADVEVESLADTLIGVYERAAEDHDAVLSIHTSGRLALVVDAARLARQRLRGLLPIEVVDAGAASVALGFVVRRVARAAQRGADLAELETLARRASQNVHAMFFAESVDYLKRDGRWARERAWPISGNGTRPILHLDDGEVKPLERVRTRSRGYDRLSEFVELFPYVDDLAIAHDAPAIEIEMLIRRIEPIYPRHRIRVGPYGPSLRAQLGPHAMAVFVDQGIGYD